MPRRMPLCRTFLAPMRFGVDSSAARGHLDRRRCHSAVVANRIVAATSHTKDGATLYRCGCWQHAIPAGWGAYRVLTTMLLEFHM